MTNEKLGASSNLKIGIVTHCKGYNYGGTLQCCALLRYLNGRGCDAELVDYWPTSKQSALYRWVRSAYRWAKSWKNSTAARRLSVFMKFRAQYCPKTRELATWKQVKEVAAKYDLCVVGSDQVWNPNFNGADPYFMLEFVEPAKRAAYAASLGVAELSEQHQERYRRALSEFAFISTREKSGAELIESLGLNRPETVLDPTLLSSSEAWREFIDEACDKKALEAYAAEPYILCYALSSLDERLRCAELARRLKEATGLRIAMIASGVDDSKLRQEFPEIEYLENLDPATFVALFERAAYVATNSFHGSVFSILFHRVFFTLTSQDALGKKSTNSRLYDLLGALGLLDRLTKDDEALVVNPAVDWARVDDILGELRERSQQYLTRIIEYGNDNK